MNKTFYGVCPVQKKEYAVSISYLDASDTINKAYIKGRAYCDYVANGNNCDVSKCPIINSAPEQL